MAPVTGAREFGHGQPRAEPAAPQPAKGRSQGNLLLRVDRDRGRPGGAGVGRTDHRRGVGRALAAFRAHNGALPARRRRLVQRSPAERQTITAATASDRVADVLFAVGFRRCPVLLTGGGRRPTPTPPLPSREGWPLGVAQVVRLSRDGSARPRIRRLPAGARFSGGRPQIDVNAPAGQLG